MRAAADERPLSVRTLRRGLRRLIIPGGAARMPCIVGRAFTPAEKVCAGPEVYWQDKAPHPSVCALRRIHLPLQGRLLGDCRLKGSPGRGAVGKAD